MSVQAQPQSPAAELVAQLHALTDRLQAVDLAVCSDEELVEVAAAHERAITRLTFAGDRQLVEITERDLPRQMGFRSVPNFFNQRLRISNPQRRRTQLAATASMRQLTGDSCEPKFPVLAEAFAAGAVGTGHITTVLSVLDQIPAAVPYDKRVAAERQMVDIATEFTPDEIGTAGLRLLGHLDPDGTLTDETDRARRRGIWIGKTRADGTAHLSGTVTPELAARLSMMMAVFGQPGLNNPDDPDAPAGAHEHADADQLAEAVQRDLRTPTQRNHDALNAALEAMFADGTLGTSHRGLPVQLIIKADLSDLIAEAGFGVSATNTLLPMADVIRLAAQVQPWLAVFEDSTPVPLFFGKGKRFATQAQRMVNFARPDGHVCSAHGCDQAAAYLEMHHAQLDWADGGLTDIVDMTGACPKHNRMVGPNPGQYTTRMIGDGPDRGRCGWRLNTRPGAPPNPERVNRGPDIAAGYRRHLEQVRAEIYGPPGDDPRPGTDDTTGSIVGPSALPADRAAIDAQVRELARLQLRQTINSDSGVENRLAALLETHLGLTNQLRS